MAQDTEGLLPVEVGTPLTRRLSRACEWLWLIAALTIPLAFNPWGVNAFELPKSALLRALSLGLLLCAASTALERPGRRRALCRPTLAALPFALSLMLALTFSVDPRVSLWGAYERQQGLLTLLPYLFLFAFTAGLLETSAQWNRLVRALIWTSAPIVVYGLLQAAGLDPLHWQSDSASPVLSTLGRSNLLGSYLALVIPLTAAASIPRESRLAHLPLLAAQVLCLLLTRARAAYLGLALVALLGVMLWRLGTRAGRGARAVAPLVGIAPALALAVAFVLAHAGPLTERIANGGSAAARVAIWAAALPLIAARPLLGYGPETLAPLFASVFPPQLIYYHGRGVYVDRAHNLGLDLTLSAGLLGLIAFGLLLGWTVWRLWQTPSVELPRAASTMRIALTAAVVGHLVDLCFSFDLTGGATVFYLLLALAAAFPAVVAEAPTAVRPVGPRAWERLSGMSEGMLYIPPLLAILGLIVILSLRPLRADTRLWFALQAGPSTVGLQRAEEAVSLVPREPTYRFAYASLLTQADRFPEAEAQVLAGVGLSPGEPRAWVSLAELYLAWANADPTQLAPAEAAYGNAIRLAPNVAVYHTGLGLVLAWQGHLAEAASRWEKAVDLDATDYVAYDYLAQAYRDLGRNEDADRAADQARYWYERTQSAAE